MTGPNLLTAVLVGAVSVFIARSAPGENRLILGYAEGEPGDRGVAVMITALHDQPIHGYSLAITYPAAALSLLEIAKRGTMVEPLEPDFYQQQIDPDKGQAVLGVIFSYQQPVVYAELPPTLPGGRPQLIGRLSFDVKAGASPGLYPLRFEDGLLAPPIYNRFSNRGASIAPALTDGVFKVNSKNVLLVEAKLAFSGFRNTYLASVHHPAPLQGYQVALCYDNRALTMVDATIEGTDMLSLLGGIRRVEFKDVKIDPSFSPTQGRVTAGVVFDYLQPFDARQVLPPDTSSPAGQSVMKYNITVNDNADQFGQNFPLLLCDVAVAGSINNVFIIDAKSEIPKLVNGNIYFSTGSLTGRVVDYNTGQPVSGVAIQTDPAGLADTTDANGVYRFDDIPPDFYALKATRTGYFPNWLSGVKVEGKSAVTEAVDLLIFSRPASTGGFKRGMINEDTRVDISDGIVVFAYLFLGKDPPVCSKAADVNDDGKVDLSDGIGLLSYLFLGSAPPQPPFAECGDDPTPDTLSCDAPASCN
ncbi:MAG: carboxypeptidase regulatory-like domain-containing protein [Planctomycetes bacterium]|nr:carboxypeptidase regulatory-like domain-containing protein [Planctomycetota bacterium]